MGTVTLGGFVSFVRTWQTDGLRGTLAYLGGRVWTHVGARRRPIAAAYS